MTLLFMMTMMDPAVIVYNTVMGTIDYKKVEMMLDKVKNNYSDDLLRLVKMMLSLNKLERSSFGFYSK